MRGDERPEEARPFWYLFEVWSQLAQRQPAAQLPPRGEQAAPFSYLDARGTAQSSTGRTPMGRESAQISANVAATARVVPWVDARTVDSIAVRLLVFDKGSNPSVTLCYDRS